MLNPFGDFKVRLYQQPSMLDVYMLADLSASMAYQGQYPKPQIIAEALRSIAASVASAGDSFGFLGCGSNIDARWRKPASRDISTIESLAISLRTASYQGGNAGLLQAPEYLPKRRALVFLLSDFHIPLKRLAQLLLALSGHDVVPLVVWSQAEYANLPQWGLLNYQDMELGVSRTLLMRPALKQKIQQAFAQRRAQLQSCFRRLGSEPIFITKSYQAGQLAQYFQRRMVA
jgi:uncharacterized protein (DUF58 family)